MFCGERTFLNTAPSEPISGCDELGEPRSTTGRSRVSAAGFFMLAGILLAIHSGCASTNGQSKKAFMADVSGMYSEAAREAIHADVKQAFEYAESEITAVCDEIEERSPDPRALEAALRWKISFTEKTNDISYDRPAELMIIAWAYSLRQKQYLTKGEGRLLFGNLQPLAVDAAVRIQRRMDAMIYKHIPPDRTAEAIRFIEGFARDNPIRGVFAFELDTPLTQEQRENLLVRVIGLPGLLASGGRDALDPTSTLAQSLDRLTDLIEDYPALVRWQTQLLYSEMSETPLFVKAESGFQDMSRSFVRLANVSETLPQDVREQVQFALDDVIAHQPEIRKTLDQARETVDTTNEALGRAQQLGETIERSIDAATRAGEAWQATAEAATGVIKQVHALRRAPTAGEAAAGLVDGEAAADGGDAISERRNFDIVEYRQTAEALSATAVQFRELLSEARSFLEGETVEQNVSRVNSLTAAALSQTAAETSGLIGLAAWRAVQLCGLVFVLAVAYRLLTHRLIRP
jgi:hypothetical protein